MDYLFFLNSILLGVGLAMDAFSVSIANGLNEPGMSRIKKCGIAGTYGFFQFIMPMIGWVCVHTIVEFLTSFHKFVPWLALILLLYIGGKMIYDSLHESKEDENFAYVLDFKTLLLQGIATSIDAFASGISLAMLEVNILTAILLIGVITFGLCICGFYFGKEKKNIGISRNL